MFNVKNIYLKILFIDGSMLTENGSQVEKRKSLLRIQFTFIQRVQILDLIG